jgi:succinate dehydrogenase/fumarate reductase cytochrome b subunit
LRRISAFCGAVPLAAFVLWHTAVVASALWGVRRFVAIEDGFARWPARWLLELLFVVIPLLVHGAVGLWSIVTRASPIPSSPYPRPIAGAMRWTGIAAGAFIALHVVELRARAGGMARADAASRAARVVADLSSTWHGVPVWGLAYLVGGACVAFHLGAGCWGFFVTTASERASSQARRAAAWAAVVLAVAVWVTLANVTVLHATGRGFFGDVSVEADEPCPLP